MEKFKLITSIRNIVFVAYIALPLISTAQISIPDTAFLRFIKTKHPAAVDVNNKVIISEAQKITAIYCNYPQVRDIEGIQYFKNLQVLSVYKSKLRYIPNIDSLTKLKKLNIFENELDSLPSLRNLANLNNLTCYSNKLKTLPDFHPNSIIDSLVAGLNLFEDVSKVSELKYLTNLGIWNCKLKKMPDLSKIIDLRGMSVGTNHYLDSLPDMSRFPNITFLDLDHNNFSEVPNLQSNKMLQKVKLNDNPLTFEDFFPYLNHPNFTNFIYYPQDSVGYNITFDIDEGKPFQYNLNIDQSINSNLYKIYKNNVLIDSNNTGIINITKASITDAGDYRFEITNPSLNKLTLYSRSIRINVIQTLDASALTFFVRDINCDDLGMAKINISSIKGGVPPYVIKLLATIAQDTITPDSYGNFDQLKEDSYDLIISDSRNTRQILKRKIQLKVNYENCNFLVITPNADGSNDELYISASGKVRIYNKQGVLVKELTGPTYWNATDTQGEVITSGYYIVKTKEETIKVSVVW